MTTESNENTSVVEESTAPTGEENNKETQPEVSENQTNTVEPESDEPSLADQWKAKYEKANTELRARLEREDKVGLLQSDLQDRDDALAKAHARIEALENAEKERVELEKQRVETAKKEKNVGAMLEGINPNKLETAQLFLKAWIADGKLDPLNEESVKLAKDMLLKQDPTLKMGGGQVRAGNNPFIRKEGEVTPAVQHRGMRYRERDENGNILPLAERFLRE